MRITRKILESSVSVINSTYDLSLSVLYFNGRTHLCYFGDCIKVGTTPECFDALSIFITGLVIGKQLAENIEEK